MDDWTPHELLLAMAGRVDDDLLGWARELVAVGDAARAVGLLTATLVADRSVLPGPVHAALVHACRATRTDLDTALPPAGPDDRPVHCFEPAVNGVVEAAVRELPAAEIEGCRVLVASRATPAGTAPGPLPHPVVLVEVEPGGKPTDVLAHQLAAALSRVGVRASVEVLTAGRPLSDYHAAARQAARPVHDRAPGPAHRSILTPISASRPDLLARRDGPPPIAGPREPAHGTPTSAGNSGSEPTAEFAVVEPAGSDVDAAHERQRPVFTDTPTFAEMQDPLLGPLSTPLLDPLLDPTLGRLVPLATPTDSPAAAPGTAGDPVQESWASEWTSGTWAMSPSALADHDPVDGPPSDPDGSDADGSDAEPPAPGRHARHRSDDEPKAGTGPDAGTEPTPEAGDGPPPQLFAPAHVEPPMLAPQPIHSRPIAPPEQVAPRRGPLPAPEPRPLPVRPVPLQPPRPYAGPPQAVESRPVVSQPVVIPPVEPPADPPQAVPPRPVPRLLSTPAPEPTGFSPDHAPETDRSSSARLSDADRGLLARLQAELAGGRSPRVDHESGTPDDPASTNGSSGPNGTAPQPRINPPDVAD